MAARGRRLKVYAAEIDGLNEWIVAAPNRQAALQAFGVHQDLFAQGLAREETDPEAAAQAQAAPETPLRRPKGSHAPFAPAAGPADWSAALAEAVPKGGSRKGQGGAKTRPRKPDRRRLDRAEAALKALEARHAEALAEIGAERERLDAREAAEQAAYGEASAKARAAVDEAARAWREAGGD